MVRIVLLRGLAVHLSLPAGARKIVAGELHVGHMALGWAVEDDRLGGGERDNGGESCEEYGYLHFCGG